MQDYHRHDLSDEAWERLEGKLPGRRGMWGGIAQDNRRFINGVFWMHNYVKLHIIQIMYSKGL